MSAIPITEEMKNQLNVPDNRIIMDTRGRGGNGRK